MKADEAEDRRRIPEGLTYRPMTMDDLYDVLEIERLSFSMPWTPDMFIVEFGNDNSCRRVIVDDSDGSVLAYMIYWTVLDEAHLMSIAVHPDRRGQGLGALLIENLIAEGREAGITIFSLEVNVRNSVAIAMYERFGFRGFGLRKKYYEDTGDDALLMELKIS